MNIQIDHNSGFCFGVIYAIEMAEDELKKSSKLFCLGDIVHNNKEVERLQKKGLSIINYDQLKKLKNCKVLIRAHGEPPETYQIALENNIELIDASCPVVLKLQNRIKKGQRKILQEKGQIVIYGKEGHAEVNGLLGQTNGKGILVSEEKDLSRIDFSRPIILYSQTTKSTKGFKNIKDLIERKIEESGCSSSNFFIAHDTLCRQVSNREPQLEEFAKNFDIILFIGGKKSSNGKSLFNACKKNNKNSFYISRKSEINLNWFLNVKSVGICGATSTPMWLMEEVEKYVSDMCKN